MLIQREFEMRLLFLKRKLYICFLILKLSKINRYFLGVKITCFQEKHDIKICFLYFYIYSSGRIPKIYMKLLKYECN